MSDEAVTELLERLSSGRVDAAWSEFLARYSALIMHVIRRYEADHERATECFMHVCGALSDDRFRKLLSFRPGGPARFRTWLMAVAANLCVDWRRREQGRPRTLRCVARLPELEQQVYRCLYLHGMSRTQCRRVLLPRYPELTEQQVADINAHLFGLLTPRQRWRLSMRSPEVAPVVSIAEYEDDGDAWELADPGAGPDELTDETQQRRQLEEALAQLPEDQRLLLRLRYEQDLTLAEVARLTRQPDPFRANRQIHAALEALGRLMGIERPGARRKNR
jgi:RNA polymerase sigma factor (sigma-70 family)